MFERRRVYGVYAWMSRHPELNAQIQRMLHELRPALARGAVDAVNVALLDAHGVAYEQYRIGISNSQPYTAATVSDAEASLASALVRISSTDVTRPKAPREGSWTILVDTHEVLQGPADDGAPPGASGSGSGSGGAGAGGAGGRGGWGAGSAGAGVGSRDGSAGPSITDGRPAASSSGEGGFWLRVDAGDPELLGSSHVASRGSSGSGSGNGTGPAAAAAEGHTAMLSLSPLKVVRLGNMGLDISLKYTSR